MKHRVSLVGAFVCAVCLAMALAGCSQTSAYTPETLTPTVSSPTIGKDGTLRVGVGGGAPFIVASSDATSSGLDIDVAAAIAGQLGLKLEVVPLGSSASEVDIDSALKKGDVDIVMSATSSDKSGSVWVSDPYTQTGVALFAPEGTAAPTRDSSPEIAAQSSSTSAWAVTNAFGDDALVAKADLLSALSAIETKDAQYVAADAVIGTYAALGQNVDVQPVAMAASEATASPSLPTTPTFRKRFPMRSRPFPATASSRRSARNGSAPRSTFPPCRSSRSRRAHLRGPRRPRPARKTTARKRRTDLLHPPTTSRSRPMKMRGRTPCFPAASSRAARRMRLPLRESARTQRAVWPHRLLFL